MSGAALQLDNVSWAYSRAQDWALKHITLSIQAGECLAVMGENGAGKTTLCRLLNGLIPHSLPGTLRGTVTVDGVDTASVTVANLARIVGMAFDDPHTQLFTARVADEVAFGLENMLMPAAAIRERVNWALAAAGLSAYAQYPPAALSGGQKQRLAIAAALAMAAKALVLDDPASQLDPQGADEVLSLIRSLRDRTGLTVIMTTNAGEEAALFADRICVLKNGCIAACDTPRRIFSNRRLLDETGIWPPQAAEFASCMDTAGSPLPGFPLNVAEAADAVCAWYYAPSTTPQSTQFDPQNTVTGQQGEKQPALIRLERLQHRYERGEMIVRGVDLSIAPHEFMAIIGRNGSGKTTVLKNISGLLRPSSGRILLQGNDTAHMPVAAIAGEIGFVMQDFDRQLFESTVYNEVAFALKHAAASPLSQEDIRRKTQEALTALDMWDKKDAFPPALDRADRVKTVFAAVLAMGSRILLLDEPIAGQDKRGCRRIMDILARLHRQGYTIIMVTHNISVAAEYARRFVVMQEGVIAMDGSPRDILKQTQSLHDAGITPPPVTRISQAIRARIPLETDALTPHELAALLTQNRVLASVCPT